MARSSVASVIKRFQRILDQEGIAYEQLILFGSHAKNLARPTSDLDLCVVVTAGVDQLKAIQIRLNSLAGRHQLLMDVIATNKKELKSNLVSPILHEIRTHGKPVA